MSQDDKHIALTPEAVEALGTFYPHQTDHDYSPDQNSRCYCGYPEWAHTPPEPAVPDWQADENCLVVEDESHVRWTRSRVHVEDWCVQGGDGPVRWDRLAAGEYGPITPVGWRRDPDSITLSGVLRDRPAEWWRDAADHGAKQGYPRYVNMACRAIADALEADHA